VHQLIREAAWFGQIASLHPLFVGGPILVLAGLAWLAVRRRAALRAAAVPPPAARRGSPGRG
jgi:hypothetical protein